MLTIIILNIIYIYIYKSTSTHLFPKSIPAPSFQYTLSILPPFPIHKTLNRTPNIQFLQQNHLFFSLSIPSNPKITPQKAKKE